MDFGLIPQIDEIERRRRIKALAMPEPDAPAVAPAVRLSSPPTPADTQPVATRLTPPQPEQIEPEMPSPALSQRMTRPGPYPEELQRGYDSSNPAMHETAQRSALGSYADLVMPGEAQKRLSSSTEPDTTRHGFKDKLLHVLSGIGRGFALGGVGGAVAGGISPGTVDRAIYRRITKPQLQQDAALERQTQDDQLQRIRGIEATTGTTLAGQLTEPARARRATEDFNRVKQAELDDYRQSQLGLRDRGIDVRESLGTRGLDLREQGQDSTNQYRDRRLGQFDKKLESDEKYRGAKLDVDRWRARIAERNAGTGERRAGTYQQSVDQQVDSADDRRAIHEDTFNMNFAQKQSHLNGLKAKLAYAQENQNAKDKDGAPLFPQGYIQSLQHQVDELGSSLEHAKTQHGQGQSRTPSAAPSHPSVGKIMQLPDGRKIRVKKVEGGNVTDYEIVP